jgi:hypothetical protein
MLRPALRALSFAARPSVVAPLLRRGLHGGLTLRAAVPVVVPQLAESITEGTIVQVLKSAGQAVAADEVVCVIETDKVRPRRRRCIGRRRFIRASGQPVNTKVNVRRPAGRC